DKEGSIPYPVFSNQLQPHKKIVFTFSPLSLTVPQNTNVYRLTQKAIPKTYQLPDSSHTPQTDQEVIAIVKTVLEKNNTWTSPLQNGKHEIQYLSLTGEQLSYTSSFANASLFLTKLTPKLDSWEIIGNDPTQALVTVYLSKDGAILEFIDSRGKVIDASKSEPHLLKQLEEAKNDLLLQKGTLMAISSAATQFYIDSPMISPGEIDSLLVQKVLLVHYVDLFSDVLAPVYVFQGSVTYEGNPFTVSVYVPALKESEYTTSSLTQQYSSWISKRVPYKQGSLFSITYSENLNQFTVTAPSGKSEEAKQAALQWFKDQGADDPEKQLNIYFFTTKSQ
ncbi:MAG TPA: hypothetical protein VJ179_01055, partial [Patescibacteria group bacterium]|nr:hypothetical protein [Patescibacteria group bacterium]